MLATAVFPAEVRATDHHPVKPGLGQNIFEPPVPLANVELVQFDGGEGQMEGDRPFAMTSFLVVRVFASSAMTTSCAAVLAFWNALAHLEQAKDPQRARRLQLYSLSPTSK